MGLSCEATDFIVLLIILMKQKSNKKVNHFNASHIKAIDLIEELLIFQLIEFSV